jgi:hypothetical protein
MMKTYEVLNLKLYLFFLSSTRYSVLKFHETIFLFVRTKPYIQILNPIE